MDASDDIKLTPEEERFARLFSQWGKQTCTALGTGFVFGFVKGYRENVHLAGVYGPSNIYDGYWATFRIPTHVMRATGQSALWGAKFGFFVSTFSALHLYFEYQREAFVNSIQSNPKGYDAYGKLLTHEFASTLPYGGAGLVVGSIFSLNRGFFGILKGGAAGLLLSGCFGVFQVGSTKLSAYLDDQIAKSQKKA